MPWPCVDEMSLRLEFVMLAAGDGANIAELCRRYGVSRKTGYKWLSRYTALGEAGLTDRSRRPANSPNRTPGKVEQLVVAMRRDHPAWGGRKIRQYLLNEAAMPAASVPAASTMTGILRRHGLMANEVPPPVAYRRFEADAPNRLWQMDFKGHFALDGRSDGGGVRCHPFTVLDDHSRYSLALQGCADEQAKTVREQLTRVFERYGLPDAIITDNGSPWGSQEQVASLTRLSVWLIRLGIKPLHSRPRHPQTLGKLERMHRTLKAELLQGSRFDNFEHVQSALDRWRHHYNHKRPHEALGAACPASRYAMSRRPMPAQLLEPEYLSGDVTGYIRHNGCLRTRLATGRKHDLQLSQAFAGQHVAIRPAEHDGHFDVWFFNYRIAKLDTTANPNSPHVTHVFERL